MHFDVVKSQAMLHLGSLTENESAIVMVMNGTGTGYKTYNINVSQADRHKMHMQEAINMLKEELDE